MKLSAWVSVSDLVITPQTPYEKLIKFFDNKSKMFGTLSQDVIFHALKESGVDGIELLITKHTSKKNIFEIKKLLNKNSIPVFSIHQSLSSKKTISLRGIERLCQISNIFRASIVVLHSDSIAAELFNKEFVEEIKKLQKKYNITIGIENMTKSILPTDTFTYNGSDFSNIIKKTDLNITFDTTHLAQVGEDILQFYLSNKERIINIHLSDYKKSWVNQYLISQIDSHLALGEGHLPIAKFLMVLKNEKYRGLITMEINAGLSELCKSAEMIKKYLN